MNVQVVDIIVSSAGAPKHAVDETIAADSKPGRLDDFIMIAPRAGQLAGNVAIESALGTRSRASSACLLCFADLSRLYSGRRPVGATYRPLFCALYGPDSIRKATRL
jgi:hypothetical protein